MHLGKPGSTIEYFLLVKAFHLSSVHSWSNPGPDLVHLGQWLCLYVYATNVTTLALLWLMAFVKDWQFSFFQTRSVGICKHDKTWWVLLTTLPSTPSWDKQAQKMWLCCAWDNFRLLIWICWSVGHKRAAFEKSKQIPLVVFHVSHMVSDLL